MLNIGNKTFMNLQEAVGWLLENNALPFQSTANYVGNTEIAMSTLVNPSPAKVRVGSLIFFADSKVSTVVGVTSNSFIVSDQYNDLVDDVVYVSNVALNASGHLIVTLSNGTNIDAGLIKQVANFSIDASQHLIANYNDGTNTDLGAIFSGNVNIAGNFTANSIIENMAGYSFVQSSMAWNPVYVGIVKTGNKLTVVTFGSYTYHTGDTGNMILGFYNIPIAVGSKLYPYTAGGLTNILDQREIQLFDDEYTNRSPKVPVSEVQKMSTAQIAVVLRRLDLSSLEDGKTYVFRHEVTFLLSDNLAS